MTKNKISNYFLITITIITLIVGAFTYPKETPPTAKASEPTPTELRAVALKTKEESEKKAKIAETEARAYELLEQAQTLKEDPKKVTLVTQSSVLKEEVAYTELTNPVVEPKIEVIDKATVIAKIEALTAEVGSPLTGLNLGPVWVEMGIKYNRHPYAGVAIALADTGLGNQLTTPFNLGNVGNSDSCPTCGRHTKSWEQGIEAIFQTLANKYLGNATKLCHLSRGGWQDCPEGKRINGGKFYASSEKNWHKNTTWAMSRLGNIDTIII